MWPPDNDFPPVVNPAASISTASFSRSLYGPVLPASEVLSEAEGSFQRTTWACHPPTGRKDLSSFVFPVMVTIVPSGVATEDGYPIPWLT